MGRENNRSSSKIKIKRHRKHSMPTNSLDMSEEEWKRILESDFSISLVIRF